MCGFAGYYSPRGLEDQGVIERMADALAHRGPDDGGTFVDRAAGVAIGHRRLSIIDLSPEGKQPMVSHSGRFVIAYNGEVFNYRSIAVELRDEGINLRGNSDTEVVLETICRWGIENAVKKFVGMFSFALWDKYERTLYLVRDRIGIKPLYYGWANGVLLFASELKALREHPSFVANIDRQALALFLKLSYVPAPYSIYKDIYKLLPGHIRKFKFSNSGTCKEEERQYWDLYNIARLGQDRLAAQDDKCAIDSLDALLKEAVGLRMISDVPLGAFLSGGIDSSTVVALMQVQSSRPVRTFSMGFDEEGYNEASHAKLVAAHLGTDHTELYVTPEEARGVIPLLPRMYDEPFADSSQIPTHLVSRLARKSVTVSLSGDGGDELFGGYNRYFWGSNIWKYMGWIPVSLRSGFANILTSMSPSTWDTFFNGVGYVSNKIGRQKCAGDKIHKLASIMKTRNQNELYDWLISHWRNADDVVIGQNMQTSKLNNGLKDFTSAMMYQDAVSYLPDDILVKVDRASMAVSLEARVPLLDHRVVEYSWSLPMHFKVRGNQGKWILKQVLYKYVPKNLLERPKMGFGVPIDSWLRGPLRGWADTLLDERRIRAEGYFNPDPIRKKWNEHLSNRRNWQYHLWNVLMFQAWADDRLY